MMLVVSLLLATLEFAGNRYSGSMSLLGDAGHVLADVLLASLFVWVEYSIYRTAKREIRSRRMVRIVAGSLLLATAVWIAGESFYRVIHPEEVLSLRMAAFAIAATTLAWLKYKIVSEGSNNSTKQAANLHNLADLFQSGAVVVIAALVYVFDWVWLDLVAASVFALLFGFQALKLITQSENDEHGDHHGHTHHH